MKVLVDAFGGDHAPDQVLLGAGAAVKELGVEITLVGPEEQIKNRLHELGLADLGMGILHAPDILAMADDPMSIRKAKKECSIAVGLRALRAGQADAFVSGGNTGALFVGSSFIIGRIKGVHRAGIATFVPNISGGTTMMLDVGANLECKPEHLAQFGLMGAAYLEKSMHISAPSVGLLNNGGEAHKGGEVRVAAYQLLREQEHFIGNIEGRDIITGKCNVIVTDGFTGNIALKSIEGVGLSFMRLLKEMFYKNTLTKLGALTVKPGLSEIKKMVDYAEYGGAPILGLAKPVIKAHGSSNAKAFKNAIRQAVSFQEGGVIEYIGEKLAVT